MPAPLVAKLPASLSTSVGISGIGLPGAVTIGGYEYILDPSKTSWGHLAQPYKRKSVPVQRQQFDTSKEPGEQSLGDLWWRRSQSEFFGGAGQLWLDRESSDRRRFLSSKGIDVFTLAPDVTLLKDTAKSRNSANTNLFCLTAGLTTQYFYVADGAELRFSTDPFAVSPVYTDSDIDNAEASWGSLTAICSDGTYVYAAEGGARGVHRTALGTTVGAHYSDLTNVTMLRYVKQRLMAGAGAALYEIVAAGAAPAAKYTHPNAGWTWTDFAEIGPAILASGSAGESSTIYRLNVNTDGTLGSAVEATEGGFPDGEIVRAMLSYLGYVLIGTNKGVRFATHDTSGNLTYGPLIPTDQTLDVRCFEGQGDFCWFGWTNYDTGATGLGRIDLRTFTVTLRPAYASDLLAAAQGNVLSAASHTSKRLFAVSGSGFWAEKTTYVSSGRLVSSRIGYSVTFDKIAKAVEFNVAMAGGSFYPEIAGSDGAFTTLGTSSTDGLSEVTAASRRSTFLSLAFNLVPPGGAAATPTWRGYTLRSLPASNARQRLFQIPLLTYDYVMLPGGARVGKPGHALEAVEHLEALEEIGDSVSFRDISGRNYEIVIEDVEFMAQKAPEQGMGWGGVTIATVRKVT